MIILDANVWISYFLPNDVNHAPTHLWLTQHLATNGRIYAPTLILPEIGGAVARVTGQPLQGQLASAQLASLPNLRLVNVTRPLSLVATQLAADLKLRGADAVYVAVAQQLGVPLLTWDREILTRATPTIPVQTP